MLSKMLFFTLFITIPTYAISDNKVFSDWGVKCEKDAFDDSAPKKCFLLAQGINNNERFITIEKIGKPEAEIAVTLFEKESQSGDVLAEMAEASVKLRVDGKSIFHNNGEIKRKTVKVIQFTSFFNKEDSKLFISEMKQGSEVHYKVTLASPFALIDGLDVTEKFSLKGFTKAINYYFQKDEKKSMAGDNEDKNVKYGAKEAFGVSEKTLNENHNITSQGEEGDIYNE